MEFIFKKSILPVLYTHYSVHHNNNNTFSQNKMIRLQSRIYVNLAVMGTCAEQGHPKTQWIEHQEKRR